jgi:hypothetical protein
VVATTSNDDFPEENHNTGLHIWASTSKRLESYGAVLLTPFLLVMISYKEQGNCEHKDFSNLYSTHPGRSLSRKLGY